MLTLLHLAIQDWLRCIKPWASPDSSIGYCVWLYHIMQIQLSPNIVSHSSSRFTPLAVVHLFLTLNTTPTSFDQSSNIED
jgi:hypothetical protein